MTSPSWDGAAALDELRALVAEVVPLIGSGHEALIETHSEALANYRALSNALRELSRAVAIASGAAPTRRDVFALAGLDERDLQIVDGLSQGQATKQLAREFGVSMRTVEKRIARLKRETNTTTMFEFGLAVAERGWLRAQTVEVDGST